MSAADESSDSIEYEPEPLVKSKNPKKGNEIPADTVEYEPKPLIKSKNPKRAGRPKLTDEERALRAQATRDKCNEARREKRNLKNAEKLEEIIVREIDERTVKQKKLDEEFEKRFEERLVLLEKQKKEKKEKDLMAEELKMLRDKLSKVDVPAAIKKEKKISDPPPKFVFC